MVIKTDPRGLSKAPKALAKPVTGKKTRDFKERPAIKQILLCKLSAKASVFLLVVAIPGFHQLVHKLLKGLSRGVGCYCCFL